MKRQQYRDFDATELYCPRCRRAVPVRKHLLLALPGGDKYDYRCTVCAFSLGEKQESGKGGPTIIRG